MDIVQIEDKVIKSADRGEQPPSVLVKLRPAKNTGLNRSEEDQSAANQ
jgi:hypothetical protein